ncbi:MAG: NIPSNAP family protein [Bacteroidales bacterium]|nr:NIPSNAP family protein [Bacteroidales bacterium]
MKKQVFFGLVLTALFLIAFHSHATERTIFQLKVYTIDNVEQELQLDNFLKEAYIPALHRAGIRHVGVFKPAGDDPLHGTRMYVLIPFKDISQFEKIEEVFTKDALYQDSGIDYLNAAHDNPPYLRIESILLRAFEAMPAYGVPEFSTPHSERIYELRSYHGATEKLYTKKVEMFNKGGEAKLFIDLGFQPIFFGEVISGPAMPNLMYLTTFENKASQDQHWEMFRNSPVWEALKSDPQYENTVSHIDKYLLVPTAYSDL